MLLKKQYLEREIIYCGGTLCLRTTALKRLETLIVFRMFKFGIDRKAKNKERVKIRMVPK